LDLINALHQQVGKYSDDLEFAPSSKQIMDIVKRGKIACLLGLEGGTIINNSLDTLKMFHKMEIQYLTLTWMKSHEWADSSTDEPKSNGLSKLGIQVIQEMNRLGML